MSKGDAPRPMSVPKEEFDRRWEKAFNTVDPEWRLIKIKGLASGSSVALCLDEEVVFYGKSDGGEELECGFLWSGAPDEEIILRTRSIKHVATDEYMKYSDLESWPLNPGLMVDIIEVNQDIDRMYDFIPEPTMWERFTEWIKKLVAMRTQRN